MRFVLILLLSVASYAEDTPRGYTDSGFSPTPGFEFGRAQDFQTTDATQSAAYSKTLSDPSTVMFEASCDARKNDGTVREGFKKVALVYRDGGAATIEGNIVNSFVQPTPTYDMTLGVSGNDVQILVTGAASHTVDWKCAFSALSLG